MNFFEKVFKILGGTYNTSNTSSYTSNIYSSYFGSSSTNITKNQLSTFQSQLESMGMNEPAGIDNMIDNFTTVDTNKDGKLTAEEIRTYLVDKDYTSKYYIQ